MPPGENKNIKLGFVVDDASVQKAQAALQSLISASQKLQEIWSKINMGGGGGGGLLSGTSVGGGGGGGVAGYQSPQGPNRAIAPGASPAAFAASRLTADIAKQKDILKNLSTEANTSMKTMSDGLRRSIDSQKRDLDSLQKSADNLLSTYKDLGQSTSSTGGGSYSYTSGSAAEGRRSVSKSPGQTIVDPGAPAKSETADKKPEKQSELMKILPRLGLAALALGGIGGIANEVIGGPQRYSTAAAARGDVFAGAFRGTAMGGDLKYAMAMDAIAKDKSKTADWYGLTGEGRESMTTAKSFFGNLKGLRFGEAMGNAMLGNGDPRVQTQLMQNQMDMLQAEMRSDPRLMNAADVFSQNAAGNVGLARSLGLGGMHLDRHGNVAGGAEMLKYSLMRSGYDVGQFSGAFGGIQGVGGRTAATHGGLTFNAMAAAVGGMGNAAGIAGLAAVGGNAGSFMGNLYGGSGTGRGGFDVVAAGQIGEAVARAIGSNGILTSGVGSLNAAMGMGGTGGPRDMMIARQVVSGMGGLGDVFSGNLDPFQKALNIGNAMRNGASGWAGSNMLASQLTPGQMMDLLQKNGKGGYADLPPELKSLGITRDMVQKQFSDTTGSIISRATQLMSGDQSTSSYKTLSSIMESGLSPAEWMKSRTRGMGSRAKAAFADQAISDIGVGIANATGSDFLSGEGQARILMGVGSKGRHGGPKVGGAGPDQEVMRGMADAFKKNVIDVIGSHLSPLVQASKDLASTSTRFGNSAENLGESATVASKALMTLAESALAAAVAQSHGSMNNVNKLVDEYRGKAGQLQKAIAGETNPARKAEEEMALSMINGGRGGVNPSNPNPVATAPRRDSGVGRGGGGMF